MAKLILLRHGQSVWNQENRFTGWVDVDLSEKGVQEAKQAGLALRDQPIDRVFTSMLMRAQKTASLALEAAGKSGLPTVRDEALNERHYGDLQGLDKDETRQKHGEEQVKIWRRSFDVPPPGGESLKDTCERVMPYWRDQILPALLAGDNVLVAAHGNSLRALTKELEGLGDDEIVQVEIATGVPIVYDIGTDGQVRAKEVLTPAA
jgi:2,3-bisphosphoglycerate-dependent phosphoglycerate mutase